MEDEFQFACFRLCSPLFISFVVEGRGCKVRSVSFYCHSVLHYIILQYNEQIHKIVYFCY